ncbi:MAG TPA: type II secretion system protein GspM [Gemmatimonadaceae bacterium]|nr:type II secretion system protein GspM [Gemmatimonadaceae bacterium]
MSWRTMKPSDRRAIVIGVLVLLPGLLFIWVWRPYRAALADARDQLSTERAALARERAAIDNARRNPQLRHAADSAMSAMQPRLFEGKDDVMAGAELASYLGDVARDTRVWLEDAATRPSTPAVNGVRTLRVEIRAESDLLGTLMFLQRLERGDRLVRVERLDISRVPRSDAGEQETLSIAATVAGYAIANGNGGAP